MAYVARIWKRRTRTCPLPLGHVHHAPARIAGLLLIALASGCAPQVYSINMQYTPSGVTRKVVTQSEPVMVTIADFDDLRQVKDKMVIGRVIKHNGVVIPVWPRFVKPSRAVTIPIKDYFIQMGYRVSLQTPEWDLRAQTISRDWGDIIVGGSIDDLEVVCEESLAIKRYRAKAKITTIFGNVHTGHIFHRVTTQSSTSLNHIILSEEKLEEQINEALSDAVNKMLDAKALRGIIRKELKEKT